MKNIAQLEYKDCNVIHWPVQHFDAVQDNQKNTGQTEIKLCMNSHGPQRMDPSKFNNNSLKKKLQLYGTFQNKVLEFDEPLAFSLTPLSPHSSQVFTRNIREI